MNTEHLPTRRRLPTTRRAIVRKAAVLGQEVYVTVSFYDDWNDEDGCSLPGEVFVKVAKQGSDIAGWVNAWATNLSVALQYGVPWPVIRDKHLHHRFGMQSTETEPSLLHGITAVIDSVIRDKHREEKE